ncbi:hypothetical protein WKI27_00800 [Brevundimonas vesicularis]|uniref:hypothetical protein n=1 Tax=Brevundimonas vesicularis TaxID=41276 RepID=UPI0030BEB63B
MTDKPSGPHLPGPSASKSNLDDLLAKEPDQIGDGPIVLGDAGGKAARDALLSMAGPFGAFAASLLKAADDYHEGFRRKKVERVIARLYDRVGDLSATTYALQNLVTDPRGAVLFAKIGLILDDHPPDDELRDHLSSVLAWIIQSDWTALFKEHRFMVDLIRQLSPQALTVLASNAYWPTFSIDSFQSSNGIVTTKWDEQFAIAYGTPHGMNRVEIGHLSHAVRELIRQDLVELPDSHIALRPSRTPMGVALCGYLDQSRTL